MEIMKTTNPTTPGRPVSSDNVPTHTPYKETASHRSSAADLPRVLVLMSTYNGERFLKEQLDSIFAQKGVDVGLMVRDDGSTDGTLRLLQDYQAQGLLTFYSGPNFGPARSFLHLLANAPESPYYSLADQDDVWLPDKLAVAVERLSSSNGRPALYASATQLCDAQLGLIDSRQPQPMLTFGEALVCAYASGCTMVMNRPLQQVVAARQPEFVEMHDRWILTLATAMGFELFYDNVPHMLYRQHGNNVIGLNDSTTREWRLRMGRVMGGEHTRYRNALSLERSCFDDMPADRQAMLALFVQAKHSLRLRLKLLGDSRFRCASKKTWRLFQLALLLNTY